MSPFGLSSCFLPLLVWLLLLRDFPLSFFVLHCVPLSLWCCLRFTWHFLSISVFIISCMLSALYPLHTAKARFSFESEITIGLLKSRKVTPKSKLLSYIRSPLLWMIDSLSFSSIYLRHSFEVKQDPLPSLCKSRKNRREETIVFSQFDGFIADCY